MAFVANLIRNPREFDVRYYSITDTNKFILNNVKGLINDDIVLNMDIRNNTFQGDAHSVWKLVREGDMYVKYGPPSFNISHMRLESKAKWNADPSAQF